MASTAPNTEMRLHYLHSELGEVLSIVTSGSSYSAQKAHNRTPVVTAQTLAQIKSHTAPVDPTIVNATG